MKDSMSDIVSAMCDESTWEDSLDHATAVVLALRIEQILRSAYEAEHRDQLFGGLTNGSNGHAEEDER